MATVLRILLMSIVMASAAVAGPAPASRPATQPSDAGLEAHATELRDRMPSSFTVVIQKPFVVIGDEPPSVVRRRAEQTVGWAVTHLKEAYFSRDPDRILDVWLFKNKESYDRNAAKLFKSKPDTPYGYYSPRDNALVMNISTGGGTLVHEIAHPFIEANFPDCPAWFNEGLGSLYEQSAERNGKIVGLPNWRLAGLQRAARDGRLLSFHDLTHLSTDEFYGDDAGRNYAEARFLCQYLQEKELLRDFYRKFSENAAADPTGFETLKNVFDDSIADRETDFRQFVMKLEFP